MFWVRKKLMTYQEIEPRPLAALQAFCQLQSRVAATHSLQLWGGGQKTSLWLHTRKSGQGFLIKW